MRYFLTKKSDLPFKRSCSFVKDIDRKLVRYIIEDLRPLDTVTIKTLGACFKHFNSRYVMPDVKTLGVVTHT